MFDEQMEFAKSLALEAGDIMLKYFRSSDIGTTWKADNTPLTVADTQINSMVIQKSKEKYPDYGVYGEEESYRLGSEWMWICDPIDGTMPYMLGIPISTFSIALTHNGLPVLGIVYDPNQDRLFYAQRGKGAFMNGNRTRVSKQQMTNAFVSVEAWTNKKAKDKKYIPIYGLHSKLLDVGAKPLTLASAVIEGCLIASGSISGLIFGLTKPEDIAALKVIVEEAGGMVTDLNGKDQRYDRSTHGAIVSNGVIHSELIDIVQKSLKETEG